MKIDSCDFLSACRTASRRTSSRRRRLLLALLAISLGFGVSAPGVSGTAYVTDQHTFNLRAGESTGYRIISVLDSGTALDVLSENERTGYSKVRLSDGTEGFILSRYLQTDPTASLQLKKATKRLRELEQSPSSLALMLARARTKLKNLQEQSEANLAELRAAEAELEAIREASKETVRLMKEHEMFADRVNYLEQLTSELQRAHADLIGDRHHRWMIFGAGVFSVGLLAGIALPRILPGLNSTTR
jgi:SH3 domain protein